MSKWVDGEVATWMHRNDRVCPAQLRFISRRDLDSTRDFLGQEEGGK